MRAVGLIVEYNPFHNGHLHHLQESLRVTESEVAVAVMSGHFLQRGAPALLDKWLRTELALAAGVDVVVELPLPWACNSAAPFADGAVRLLDALGVQSLCFGSESGLLPPLQSCADLLRRHPAELLRQTRAALRRGETFPAARAQMVAALAGAESGALLASPNNILGIEYLAALGRCGSGMVPFTIPRLGPGYHDVATVGQIASATGIRTLLAAGSAVWSWVPEPVRPLLAAALTGGQVTAPNPLYQLLVARLLRGPASLQGLYQVTAGIEQRLVAAAQTSADLAQLTAAVKSKQLTLTRIQRILCYCLLELTATAMAEQLAAGPAYLRLLGCSGKGRRFLAATRKSRGLPLVDNLSRVQATLQRHYGIGSEAAGRAQRLLQLDLQATAVFTLLQQQWRGGNRNRDYFEEVRQGS